MINTTEYVQHPFPIDGRFSGEVAYDYNVNVFIVWNGTHWEKLGQDIEWEDKLSQDELVEVRTYIRNREKYEKLLRDHFPEDFL